MKLDRQSTPAHFFSKCAGHYDDGGCLHREFARKLSTLLPASMPASILEIGCGSGFFTEYLAAKYSGSRISGVDCSEEMLTLSRNKLKDYGNVDWLCADARRCCFDRRFDLITSCSALQWMQPLQPFFRKLHAQQPAGGRFIFSLMVEGTLAELRSARAQAAPGKAYLQTLPTAESTAGALAAAGYRLIRQECETRKARFESAGEAVSFIKAMGFTGRPLSSGSGSLTRSELLRLMELYDRQWRTDDEGVPVSFAVYYAEAEAC